MTNNIILGADITQQYTDGVYLEQNGSVYATAVSGVKRYGVDTKRQYH